MRESSDVVLKRLFLPSKSQNTRLNFRHLLIVGVHVRTYAKVALRMICLFDVDLLGG